MTSGKRRSVAQAAQSSRSEMHRQVPAGSVAEMSKGDFRATNEEMLQPSARQRAEKRAACFGANQADNCRPRPCNHSQGLDAGAKRPRRRRSWRARGRAACARAWGPAAARQGVRAECAARPKTTRGPWRRLPAPEHAQFSRARFGRPVSRCSTIVANDWPWLPAEAARSSQPFETSGPARRTCDDARLCDRREVEPVRDTFVAKRRPVHPADQSCHSFRYGRPLCHDAAIVRQIDKRKSPARLAGSGKSALAT